ncbi:hypothetical protein HBH70_059420 [Parastagonospora nodorum]|nr:hypothetical protein HBH53_134840 [Parastagonospora nodorum]KAH3984202.1 hypothetical protein HBH52_065200 [Parastagonospora nodorum]KAH3985957.1 hypothetical protein HBH51_023980 [Parastagonospora nodorum]KAH4003551.1 hypothetical protein HBI10_063160 [Parastagonospora nodorum]KAH4028707.1 hypothetical protein HBI13_039250 [Parastagonospora nodorum]
MLNHRPSGHSRMGVHIVLLLLLTVQSLFVTSVPADLHTHCYFHDRGITDKSRRVDEKPLLRLMPLGASITQGWDIGTVESLQNGYCKPLRQELRHRGYAVNMFGSRAHGDFSDRQHEGWSGLKIDDVALKMLPVMTSQKPNLVLILLGSNDCFQGRRENNMDYVRTMKDRMRTLIERVYSTSSDVTIILAAIPPTTDAGNEPYIQTANAGYKELASELQGRGWKIELVDMYTTWLKPEDYSDSIHFKPQGYAKLAALFVDGFYRAEKKGWLTAPIDTGIGDSAGCYPGPNGFHGPVRTQLGSDGGDLRGDGVRYCDMFGRGNDDYLWSPPYWNGHPHVLHTQLDSKFVDVGDWDGDGLCDILTVDRATGNVDMWRNTYKKGDASPTFGAPVRVVDRNLCPQTIPPSNQNDPAHYLTSDLPNFVWYICMSPKGLSLGWLNRPSGLETLPSTNRAQIKIAEGFSRSEHRWADVNGDGLVDFLAVEAESGNVILWINCGMVPSLTSGMLWEKRLGFWTPGKGKGANVHFPKLSRSGRADMHVVDEKTAQADTWFNDGECRGARDDGEVKDPGLPKIPA